MDTGIIVILNGASSSGKTSILKALQDLAPEPYLNAGLDTFLWMLPRRYFSPPHWGEVFEYHYDPQDPARLLEIRAGPLGHRLVSSMHRTAELLARAGQPVILDHVLMEKDWLLECAQLFAGLRAYLVGVVCPLEVLEQRERARKDRTLGQARAQYPVVHAGLTYDLEVDTSQYDPEACARMIYAAIQSGRPSTALQESVRRLETLQPG